MNHPENTKEPLSDEEQELAFKYHAGFLDKSSPEYAKLQQEYLDKRNDSLVGRYAQEIDVRARSRMNQVLDFREVSNALRKLESSESNAEE